ncbi:hypothetical protein F750_2420 [Streptomyces sp. PAMC 26508]|nr:hypothetical protein F750_2420 [Streptomyces sp. PAMC 26508]
MVAAPAAGTHTLHPSDTLGGTRPAPTGLRRKATRELHIQVLPGGT